MKEVLARQQLVNADTQIFQPKVQSALVDAMLEEAEVPAVTTQNASLLGRSVMADDASVVDRGVRLAFLSFLESLFGDVVYHMCSVEDELEVNVLDTEQQQQGAESLYLVFEVDSFLDARIELGCREFFRQFFQSEVRS